MCLLHLIYGHKMRSFSPNWISMNLHICHHNDWNFSPFFFLLTNWRTLYCIRLCEIPIVENKNKIMNTVQEHRVYLYAQMCKHTKSSTLIRFFPKYMLIMLYIRQFRYTRISLHAFYTQNTAKHKVIYADNVSKMIKSLTYWELMVMVIV